MARRRRPPGGPLDWIWDRVLRGAIRLARGLPYRWRVPVFGWLARRVIGPLAGLQRRAEAGLAHVWPDMPAARRRAIAAAAVDNAGRVTIESYSREDFHRMGRAAPVEGPGLATLVEAKAAGRPAILLTGHLGNHLVLALALDARGYEVAGLYRPMTNPFVNAHYVATLEGISGPPFPQTAQGMRAMLRYLHGGGFVAVLNDLHVGKGVALDFLGRPAMTSTSAAEIALRLGAALVPAYVLRAPDGLGFRVVVEAEIPTADPESMTAAGNASLSARISASPEQWNWMHRRWKRIRPRRAAP